MMLPSSTAYSGEDATMQDFVTWFQVPNFTAVASSTAYTGEDAMMHEAIIRYQVVVSLMHEAIDRNQFMVLCIYYDIVKNTTIPFTSENGTLTLQCPAFSPY